MRTILLIIIIALIGAYFREDLSQSFQEAFGTEAQSDVQTDVQSDIQSDAHTEPQSDISTENTTKPAYESARDVLNGMTNIQPSFIEIGKYQPAYMTEDMDGIWLEYQARSYNTYGLVPHYIRLRDLNRIVLGQTASGICQLKLTGPDSKIGYYWEDNVGWERGLDTLFFRSSNCASLTRAGEAFVQLIELDGGGAKLLSILQSP